MFDKNDEYTDNELVDDINIKKWAYIDDLMPKGG